MIAIGIVLIVLGGVGILIGNQQPVELRMIFAIPSFIGITSGIGFLLIKRVIRKVINEKETDK